MTGPQRSRQGAMWGMWVGVAVVICQAAALIVFARWVTGRFGDLSTVEQFAVVGVSAGAAMHTLNQATAISRIYNRLNPPRKD